MLKKKKEEKKKGRAWFFSDAGTGLDVNIRRIGFGDFQESWNGWIQWKRGGAAGTRTSNPGHPRSGNISRLMRGGYPNH